MHYYDRLKELRENKDFTQEQIARLLRTDHSYYSKYEKGVRPLPIEHLITLCKFYKVSSDYILGLPEGLTWYR